MKEEFQSKLDEIPDELLASLALSMPWQYDPTSTTSSKKRDPDGFDSPITQDKEDEDLTREVLQRTCWIKYQQNPQVNTAVRGIVGRLTGNGFETTSGIPQIQEQIEITEKDHRNRLYNFWPKYIGRMYIEGEMFLSLTVHPDGFIEVDFIDPSTVHDIYFHSRKTLMPLFYKIHVNGETEQVPSIYIARYPELLADAKAHFGDFNISEQQTSRDRKWVYRPLKGYCRFIIGWDKGFMTKRAVSYLRTILKWLNHYEDLKNYEIDHKKSSGAYTWVFTFTDIPSFRTWLALSDDDRKKTGVMQKMEPGCKLFLPPGMTLKAENPKLPSIKEQDTDILQMVTSGLNESSDITTGTPAGPYSSVRATRGPMSDRVSDEVAYLDRFLKYDFWSSVFFLKSVVSDFPETFKVEEAIDFKITSKKIDNEDGIKETKYYSEPVYAKVNRKPEDLVDISYPVSETVDFEGRARAFLGVKHGPMAETLGVPNSEIAKKIGTGNYRRMRLQKATEDKQFPKLVYTVDAESLQEEAEGEPKKKKGDE